MLAILISGEKMEGGATLGNRGLSGCTSEWFGATSESESYTSLNAGGVVEQQFKH